MKDNAGSHSIKVMARVLGVSRSGFHAWKNRSVTSPRGARKACTDTLVADAYRKHRGRYGAPRLVHALAKDGVHLNRKTVARSLSRNGLRAKAAKKFKVTTQSGHGRPVADNLLQRNFTVRRPNRTYVGDITYIWTDEGWMYLAVFIDLFSRTVVGWALSERMTADLVCDAFAAAMKRRGNPKGVIVHTDRGIQYCSREFQDLLTRHRCRSSMSRKGDCWDNAVAESFFHSLKVESIHGVRFETRDQLKESVFEYIEVFYNRQRLHSSLGYLSPADFEARKVA